MGGKSTGTGGNNGYTGGLTPYAQNLFGGSGSTDTSGGGNSSMQNLGQRIMQASNKFSAQQSGPTEQAVANIGNALVNKFATQPAQVDKTPNLFGGPTPTFTPHTPMPSDNPLLPGTPMPQFRPTFSTPGQLNPGTPMFNSGSTGLQMNQPITSPMTSGAPNLFGR